MSHDELTTTEDAAGKSGMRRLAMRVGAVAGAVALAGAATAATASAAVPSDASLAAYFTLGQGNWQASDNITIAAYTTDTSGLKAGYQLIFQPDGNLVLYSYSYDAGQTYKTALWASGSENQGVTQIDWSASGDLKLQTSGGWTECTLGGGNLAPGGRAVVQKDGNFVFYNTSGNPTWASGTNGDVQRTVDACGF